jgi:translation initiation factor eIF-2B subunit delta
MITLEDIINDKKSGQSGIIRKTIELLKSVDEKERLDICKKVCEVHSSMVGLKWLLKCIENGKEIEEIESTIEKADKICIEKLRELVKGKTVVTISRSHTLEKGLITAKHVIVLESSPRKEGWDMARYLKGRGISVSVFPDCAMAFAVRVCDFAVVGADAVYKNGFVNKTGTLPLALCCKHFSKNLFVVAQSYKFAEEEYDYTTADLHFKDEMLFEFTPEDFVKEYVTDLE